MRIHNEVGGWCIHHSGPLSTVAHLWIAVGKRLLYHLFATRVHEAGQKPQERRAPEPCLLSWPSWPPGFTRWTRTPEGDEHQNHVCCLGPHDHQASRGGPEPQRATSTRTMSVVLALMTTRLHEVDQNPRGRRASESCLLSWPS